MSNYTASAVLLGLAARLPLLAAAGAPGLRQGQADAVEVAIDVELQQHGRAVEGPSGLVQH